MAGLAALLSFGSDRTVQETLTTLSASLTARGSEEARASCGAVHVLARAALPIVHGYDDMLIVIDGMGELSTLAGRFAAEGPSGLVGGADAYVLVVADNDGLVLARNGDGPALYYARLRGAVLVASEPAALLAAGVPTAADATTVARFLATGECDGDSATFYAGIRKVLPGQIVQVGRTAGRDGLSIRHSAPIAASRAQDVNHERTGVIVDGLSGMALLGEAIADQHRAVPVYSATFPGLSSNGPSYTSAVLGPIPDGTIRHRAIPFFSDEIDVDAFLADVGEPLPDLSSYLSWAIARATGGEVDALRSGSGWRGPHGHLTRLADRVAARYGVILQFPYRDAHDETVHAELRKLPSASARAATSRVDGAGPPLREVLKRLRAEVTEALLYPRDSSIDHLGLATMQALDTAVTADVERVWRRYVLERWLRHHPGASGPQVPQARRADGELAIGNKSWQRHVIQTEPLTAGDRFAEKIAWYIAEFIETAAKPARQAMRQPWQVLISGKALAVVQGRAQSIWDIRPTRYAHLLTNIAGDRIRLSDPWSMQVALEQGGKARMGLAVLCARVGLRSWHDRIAGPALRSVCPPRENACQPGHLAVIPPPQRPAEAAGAVIAALRKILPPELFDTLAGCAVVGVDADGLRLQGWSGSGRLDETLLTRLCADNPFGQDDRRTPIMLVMAHAVAPKKVAKKPKARR